MWLIVPVICRVTDGHWILFLRKMGHNMYSAPKYRPSAHTHLQQQPCPGWKPSFGLTLDPLSRSVEFLLRMKNDELWALFTEAVFKYAVFARTGLRRENITSCLFQGAVRKRIHTKSTSPPLPNPLVSKGNFLHPSLVSVIHPLTELHSHPSAT